MRLLRQFTRNPQNRRAVHGAPTRQRDPGIVRFAVLLLVAMLPVGLSSQPQPSLSSTGTPDAMKLYQAGLALVAKPDLDEAIRTFEKAIELEPRNPALLDAEGAAYSLRGDLPNARDYFLASLRVDPAFAPARKNLGITLFGLGQYDEAAGQFRALPAFNGQQQAIASLFLGMIAEKKADYSQAATLLGKSGPILYEYPEGVLSLARVDYELKNFRLARQTLDRLDGLKGTTGAQYLAAADLRSRLGDQNKAFANLNKAGESRLSRADIDFTRAALLAQMNRHDEAQSLLENLASTRPRADVFLLLAQIAQKRGDIALAMKSLKQAADLDPNNEESYLEFSALCADHGNDPLALEAANIGLDHLPNSYRLLVQKGAVLEKLGHLDAAEETLRQAADLQKNNSLALLSLAIVEAHAGKLQEAENTLAGAIRDSPSDYYMHYYRGTILLKLMGSGSSDSELRTKAVHSFEQAIRLNPTYADSYYQLSTLYIPANSPLAEHALLKCLQLDSMHEPAEYALARLYVATGRKAKGQELLARFKTQLRSEELNQQKQLKIDPVESTSTN